MTLSTTLRNFFFVFVVFGSCNNSINPPKKSKVKSTVIPASELENINLPDGFQISIYAEGVKNARSMSLSPSGVLFVGTRGAGNVYALEDSDNDFQVDKIHTLIEGGNMPNGVAYMDGDLYVAEVDRILKFSDIESKLENPGEPEVVFDGYPTDKHHGWKYIAFGPDGKLYVPVGAPCNICESDEIYASITSINRDGTDMEVVQHGVRNTVGFTWHPETGDLWFTDNGRDMLGDDIPACELNVATEKGMHFGYPYCHQGDLADPDFGHKKSCNTFTQPVQNLGPHTAPLGVEFCNTKMFPKEYHNKIFMAEHGSWNRSKKIGYRVTMVELEGNNSKGYSPFIDGWLNEAGDDVSGRPVDIEWMPDGSMLISDDFADMVYRVTYSDQN